MDERIKEIETRLLTGLNYTGCQKDASFLLSIITSLQAENKKYKEALQKVIEIESKPNLRKQEAAIKLCVDIAQSALREE